MDFSKFDEVIGLLEDNKEKILENDFMKIYEGIQNFYETIEKLNEKIEKLNEKVGCQCKPDIGLCSDPNKYSKCKNFVKYKKDIPVFSFYINGRPTELQLVLEDKISIDIVKNLLKKLTIIFNNLNVNKRIRLTFVLFDLIMRCKSILQNTDFKKSLLKKLDEFKKSNLQDFDKLSKKFKLERNVLEIWEEQIRGFSP